VAKEILCGFGVDVDAVAGWLGSYGGEDSPDDISRGLFAGEVGSPRLLKLFARLGIKTTWFIPGHSIETFPAEMKAVAEAGHEIGIHGYSHENPIAMTREQEEAVLDKCIDLVTQLSGRRPTGYVAPWWEFSTVTNELLLERGIKYERPLRHDERDGGRFRPAISAKRPSKGEVKNVRAVRGSWRCRALDRRRRETWCFYPQHRSGVAPPRADEASGGGKPDSASLRHDGCRLAGQCVRPVDGHRQDRDRR
jgi:peptidoglycan/xylan/chitin deacetylase (PgdA/CDA1 family)